MLSNEDGVTAIYPRLLKLFVQEYEWSYQDRFNELPFLQQSFLFILYLLHKHGDDWQTNRFYEDLYIKAFPRLLNEVQPPTSYYTPEKCLRLSYSVRCLERFAEFFGLVEIERPEKDRYSEDFRVRKLPLLDQVVEFRC